MDILKKLLNNPAFDHLAENILSFMDIDKAMETMIESELLDEERKVMRKMLRKLMVNEAQKICEKQVIFKSRNGLVNPSLFEMYPFFKEALQELKNSESLESFNQLYDILVWLQPGESQLNDETQLQRLYGWSRLNRCPIFEDAKGPKEMLSVFEVADIEDWTEADATNFSKAMDFQKEREIREMEPYIDSSDYSDSDSSIDLDSFIHSINLSRSVLPETLRRGPYAVCQSHESVTAKVAKMECAVCLQPSIHPVKLPCNHIFCFLCVKGVTIQSQRCPMCRREIPTSFLEHPTLVINETSEPEEDNDDEEEDIEELGAGQDHSEYKWYRT